MTNYGLEEERPLGRIVSQLSQMSGLRSLSATMALAFSLVHILSAWAGKRATKAKNGGFAWNFEDFGETKTESQFPGNISLA
jgi:hypothetical protein